MYVSCYRVTARTGHTRQEISRAVPAEEIESSCACIGRGLAGSLGQLCREISPRSRTSRWRQR